MNSFQLALALSTGIAHADIVRSMRRMGFYGTFHFNTPSTEAFFWE